MPEHADADLRHGAKTAAAAAAVGAAVGVARAIAHRAESAAHEPEPELREPQETADHEPEPEREPEPMKGAGRSEIRRLTRHAQELLGELSGVEVERVSAVERVDGGWRVTLEAVELRRIPDSTDVLATYAVDLDGAGELVRYERLRRYARSQSDGGGR